MCLEHHWIKSKKTSSSWQKKQKVSCKNNYHHRWHSDSGKYTRLSRNTTGTSCHKHWPSCQCTQNEYMYLNQTGNIYTLGGSSLKIVDKFTSLGSSVSSTETDINTRLTKAWTAIDKLSIIWKSDLTNKMKQFLPSSGHVDTTIWMHYMDANLTNGEKAWRQLHNNAVSNFE